MKNLIFKLLNETPEVFSKIIFNSTFSPDKYSGLSEAALQASKEGMWMEFGVFNGVTINILTQFNKTYGFDSWEGLPEDWNQENLKGIFNTNGTIPFTPNENTVLIKGWFDESLPKFIKENHINKVSLLHLDADLYSSTKCVLDNLKPFFKGECIIIFDEFFNYPDWENHEYKAFKEFVYQMKEQILDLQILSYASTAYCSVAFKVIFK